MADRKMIEQLTPDQCKQELIEVVLSINDPNKINNLTTALKLQQVLSETEKRTA